MVKITPIDKLISNNLKRLLLEKNIRASYLARLLGVKETTISAYLNNRAVIGKEMLLKLCIVLYVKPVDFYREDPISQESAPLSSPRCNADPACKKICSACMNMPPDDRESVGMLADILESQDQETITAIKQNLKQFRKLVDKYDLKTHRKRHGGRK